MVPLFSSRLGASFRLSCPRLALIVKTHSPISPHSVLPIAPRPHLEPSRPASKNWHLEAALRMTSRQLNQPTRHLTRGLLRLHADRQSWKAPAQDLCPRTR